MHASSCSCPECISAIVFDLLIRRLESPTGRFFWKKTSNFWINLQMQNGLQIVGPAQAIFLIWAERLHMLRQRESSDEKCNQACIRCRGHVIRQNGIMWFLLLNQLEHVFHSAVKRSLFIGTPERDFPMLTCMCAPWAHTAQPFSPCGPEIKRK